jgi:SynChlorMet cassette protein ScmC
VQEHLISNSYILDLHGSLVRCLVGHCETSVWLDQLASIMTLKPGKPEELRKISFVPAANGADGYLTANVRPPLPGRSNLAHNTWRMDNLGALRIWTHFEAPDVVCELVDTRNYNLRVLAMGQALFPIYRAAIDRGGMPFHSALLERDGKGILISASGGKGKSTCCRQAPRPWNALCDDETLIVRSGSGFYNAHPFPTWSDYLLRRSEPTWDVQRPTQLSAIFFLDQGESDQVVPMGEAAAAARIMRSAGQVCRRMWQRLESCVQRETNVKLFANACSLAKDVPAFTLRASLTGRFWKSIEKILQDATPRQ